MTDWSDAEITPLEGLRSLVDVWAGDRRAHARIVAQLVEQLDDDAINVLSLGPPLRLSVEAVSFVAVLDQIPYERVRLRFWPYGFDDDDEAAGDEDQGEGDD